MDTPSFSIRRTTATSRGPWQNAVWYTLVAAGIVAHLLVAVIGGNHLYAPWSSEGDAPAYILLAHNLVAGDGFTFAHVPTAFRAPGYPYLLAALMRLAPLHWIVLLRVLQFAASLLTAWLCARLARNWFGETAGRAALAIALLLPTLLYFTGEILTECIAALLTIVYVVALDESAHSDGWKPLALLGAIAGLAALERFNAAVLAPIACGVVFLWLPRRRTGSGAAGLQFGKRVSRALIVAASCGIVLAPWLIHTAIAFHGQALYSTDGGYAAVEGIITPINRTQLGETEAVKAALGWVHQDVETNTPRTPAMRDEVALNRHAWAVAKSLARQTGWRFLPESALKLSTFWLGTDQFFRLSSFSRNSRMARRLGTLAYWAVLIAAIAGWIFLRDSDPSRAAILAVCAVLISVAHVPFVMISRYRIPIADPVLCSLAGGGCAWFLSRIRRRQAPAR
jgi:4-amino-4-deoxy-L-arabinose transferase-like glycosyltransferase